MATIKLEYEKQRKLTYDIFVDGKKAKKDYQFKQNQEIELVEQNIAMSKWWWIILFIGIISGNPEDCKEVKSERKRVKIKLNNIHSAIIKINANDKITTVEGTDNYIITDSYIEACPQTLLRVKRYKTGLIIGTISFLSLIFLSLMLTYLLKK